MTRFGDGSFVPLAVTTRSGLDESLHHGAGAVLSASGVLVALAGDAELVVYPRSSLKPFQAHAMVGAGLDLPAHLLAVVAASHSGAAMHLEAVVEILERHGLGVADLQNTPDRPYGAVERDASIARGEATSPLFHDCSGKHAGMLATCKINDWSTESYLDLDHPLQQTITREVDRLAGRESVRHIGIDGCGAPTHAMPLIDVARALRQMTLDASPVIAAMSEHPALIGGAGRDVTLWMEAVSGLAAKEGADGVMVAALPDGRAGAFKVADGSARARQAVAVELLRLLDVDVDGVHAATRDRVRVRALGHGEPIGECLALPWPSIS